MTALVAGAGGFIGGHLVARLLADGEQVVATDRKPVHEWHQVHPYARNLWSLDLRDPRNCGYVCAQGADAVYMLAADMGGMGFIETHRALCSLSVLISTNMLLAAQEAGVRRYFYSSSACVYPGYRQTEAAVTALRETDAYPADPEDGYGWEKLFSERTARHFYEDYGLETRVARYHNVMGTHGTWRGGREKAPAAICRKVAEAALSGRHEIEIWGDGEQTRSFMQVEDCVEGTLRLARSDVREPLNLGSDRLISINGLVTLVERVAGVDLERRYDPSAPLGVRGRNSDNALVRARLGWAPSASLESGLERLYAWVLGELRQ